MPRIGTLTAVTTGSIADAVYAPSVGSTYTTTSTTPVAVDSVNMLITFTAPDNGVAWIDVVALMKVPGGANLNLALIEGATVVASAPVAYNQADMKYHKIPFRIAGLTPGSSHTYKLGWSVDNASFTATLYAANGSAFLMRVTQGK